MESCWIKQGPSNISLGMPRRRLLRRAVSSDILLGEGKIRPSPRRSELAKQQSGLTPKKCQSCGTEYTPYRAFQRACSRRCREKLEVTNDAPHAKMRDFICIACSSTFSKMSTSGHNKFCDSCQDDARAARAERKNANRRVSVDPSATMRNLGALLRQRYQMSVDEHLALVAAQQNLCAICHEPPKPDGVKSASRLHIDHDHVTGKVRGLLCNHCNRGLGAFRDRPDLLRAAIGYLGAG
jgi:Recombination endonuclease VII